MWYTAKSLPDTGLPTRQMDPAGPTAYLARHQVPGGTACLPGKCPTPSATAPSPCLPGKPTRQITDTVGLPGEDPARPADSPSPHLTRPAYPANHRRGRRGPAYPANPQVPRERSPGTVLPTRQITDAAGLPPQVPT
jgi:hypothetical protein